MRFASLAIAGLIVAAPAAADEAPKAVVELFTSQGCSSCPPADRLASEIAHEGDALVLTLAVDYWDYLGWKDTLANPANSARQRAYAMARGDRKVFTPQIVVNGTEATIGGDRLAVEAAIDRAEDKGGMPLPVSVEVADGRVKVAVAPLRRSIPDRHAEVWAFAIEHEREVGIGRGENAGRTVTYANVVRHMTRLGVWDGSATRFEIAADEMMTPGTDAVAVLVQAGNGGKPGEILGAGRFDNAPPPPQPAATSRLMREPY